MKVIRYQIATKANCGTDKDPEHNTILSNVEMDWNEANEEIAKREAWGGEYEIVDDGQEAPIEEPTLEERTSALEAAMLELLGVNADG